MGKSIAHRALYHQDYDDTMPRIGTFWQSDDLWGVQYDNGQITTVSSCYELWLVLSNPHNRGTVWYCHEGSKYAFKYLVPYLVSLLDDKKIDRVEPAVNAAGEWIAFKVYTGKHIIHIRDSSFLLPNGGDIREFFMLCREHFGVYPGITAGQTAIRAFRASIPENTIYFRTRHTVEDFCREAYYGGQVYLTDVNRVHRDMIKLDIHGAYASVMKTHNMPLGTAVRTSHYHDDKIGFYRCLVTAPDTLPRYMVPVRRNNATVWARGRFRTTLDSYTVNYARQRGYSIETEEGYYFLHEAPVFREFISKCERLEMAAGQGPLRIVVKGIRNAIYGKLGARPDQKRYHIGLAGKEGYTPVPDADGLPSAFMSEQTYKKDASYMFPHWAACITALARIYLDECAAKLDYQGVYYDTDSIVVPQSVWIRRRELFPASGYGSLKVEAEYDTFLVRAPKSYLGEKTTGEVEIKAKGVPRDNLSAPSFLSGLSVEYTQRAGMNAVLHGAPIERPATRVVAGLGDDAWELQSDGYSVLPLAIA